MTANQPETLYTSHTYDLGVGECLVIQDGLGMVYAIAVKAIGKDIDGDDACDLLIWSNDDSSIWFSIREDEAHLTTANGRSLRETDRTTDGSLRPKGWPRIWYLSRYLVGRKTRQEVFDRVFGELLEDYTFTRLASHNRFDRLCLNLAFAQRTSLAILDAVYEERAASKIPVRALLAIGTAMTASFAAVKAFF